MNLLLIRHGDTERASKSNFNAQKGRPDPSLSSGGRDQAELLGKRLANSGIQAIYTSDLVRTVQTAEILNRHIGVSVITREALREIDMGMLHERSWEKIREIDPGLHDEWHRHTWDMPYSGGECGGDAAARAMKVLEEITASGLDDVAVVTHGGIIRVLVCAVLGLGQEKRFLIGPFENTSISTIKYYKEKKEFTLFALNDFSHLANLQL